MVSYNTLDIVCLHVYVLPARKHVHFFRPRGSDTLAEVWIGTFDFSIKLGNSQPKMLNSFADFLMTVLLTDWRDHPMLE